MVNDGNCQIIRFREREQYFGNVHRIEGQWSGPSTSVEYKLLYFSELGSCCAKMLISGWPLFREQLA